MGLSIDNFYHDILRKLIWDCIKTENKWRLNAQYFVLKHLHSYWTNIQKDPSSIFKKFKEICI